MLKNYFKVAWRNLKKNKVSSFINITGLATGMAVAILIGLWIYDELSFNRYFQNYGRIAQLKLNANYNGEVFTIGSNPMPLGIELRNSYQNLFKYVVMSTTAEQHVIASGDKTFTQQGNYMEADAPEMLTLEMVNGSRAGLKDLNTIMLSESLSHKLFGNADPIDKVLTIDKKSIVKVTGVYKDLPDNTEFKNVAFIAPLELYILSNDWAKNSRNDWTFQFVQIYTQIAPNADFEKISSTIRDVKLRHVSGEQALRKPALFLQPMSKWHLYSKFENGINVTSDQLKFIWFYGIIGIFVLLLACINFMNLSTAHSEKRAREVGIRKAIGSVRGQLIKQFFSESILTVALAFVFSLVIVQVFLPWFNEVADKKISILWTSPFFWLASIAFIIFTGLLAGSYPAVYLSSFNAVKVLKGTFRAGRLAAIPRKALVVLQFTASITLIIGTVVVYRQIQFAKNRPVGYSRAGLLQVQMTSAGFKEKYDLLRTALKNTGTVTEIAESASPVTSIWSTNKGFSWNGKEPSADPEFATLAVTHDYGKTVGWQFVNGRDFSREFGGDSSGFIVNESAAKIMQLKNPVGETIRWKTEWEKSGNFKILGVVKDMVMESPFMRASPTIFFLHGDMNYMLLKINPNATPANAISKIEAAFKKIIPGAPLDYKFVDDEYAKKFSAEVRVGNLASVFALLAIFISCLGLFGLSLFVAEQRTREIGLRKVLGASVFNLWRLLSKEFAMLIIISLVIAAPTAYYFMHSWLQNYQYRTEISWWIFMGAGIGAMLLTLFTVSFQAIKAAIANPVKSLRTE